MLDDITSLMFCLHKDKTEFISPSLKYSMVSIKCTVLSFIAWKVRYTVSMYVHTKYSFY